MEESTIKSVQEAISLMKNLQIFAAQKNIPNLMCHLVDAEEEVQKHALLSCKTQTSLLDYHFTYSTYICTIHSTHLCIHVEYIFSLEIHFHRYPVQHIFM